MACSLALHADRSPFPEDDERGGYESYGDKTEHTVAPVQTEFREQGRSEDGEASAKCRTEEVVTSIH